LQRLNAAGLLDGSSALLVIRCDSDKPSALDAVTALVATAWQLAA